MLLTVCTYCDKIIVQLSQTENVNQDAKNMGGDIRGEKNQIRAL